MSRNGAGVYSLPAGNPVVTGTTITASWANNTLNDIATALTSSIAVDGQSTVTANLPMSGFKLTGCGSASASGEPLVYGQAINGTTGTFTGAVSGASAAFTGAVTAGSVAATSAAFSGTVTGVTPTVGDSSTKFATTAFVAATSFTTNLPGQGGNAGKFLTTNGSAASWGTLRPWADVSTNSAVVANSWNYVRTNVSAITLTLPTSPTNGDLPIYFKDGDYNAATNSITVDPGGSNAIENGSNGETLVCTTNGASFSLQFLNGKWRVFGA